MKISKTTISTILLASLIGFQLLSINVHSVQPATSISVINPITENSDFIFYTNTTPVGSKFNATLWISGYGNPPVYAWQVRLNFNSAFLNITRAWTALGDPAYIFQGHSTMNPQAAISSGTILVGDTVIDVPATPPPEPAKLATIELKITSVPIIQNLLSSLDINNADTYLLDENLDEMPSIIKTNGQFQYIDLDLSKKTPSTITVNANPASVFPKDNVTISGTITPTRPSAPVTIYARLNEYDYNWFTLANVETDSTSFYFYIWKPMNAAVFQIKSFWPGDQNTLGAYSPVVTLTVNKPGPPPPPPPPSQLPTIWVVNPQTENNQFTFYANATQVGDRFNATIWINKATNASAWQITLTYKQDLLNATRAWIPYDSQYIFHDKSSFPPVPSFQPGSIKMGDVTVPTSSVSFATPKILGIIEFQILMAPPEKEAVFSNLAIDNIDTYIIDPQTNEIPISKMNGYYQYVGLGGTPSAPTEVKVMPPHLTVGDPNATLPTPPFTVNIAVSNVTDLYAWQVKIYFIPSTMYFFYSTFPEGHVFDGKQFNTTPLVVGADEFNTYLLLGAYLLGNQTGFSGSGILCQLTFIGTTAGNSPLIFASPQNETMLLNSNLNSIPFDAVDGLVTVLGAPPPPPPPPRDPSKISLYANPQTVFAGQSVNLTGEIIPWRSYTDVMIFARQTNGTAWLLLNTVQTNQYSQFSYTWITDTPGWYELKSAWSGDQYTLPAESPIQFVQVEPRPAHELIVNLIAPDYTIPDASTALNVSVYNLGANTETNVQVELFIEGTLVTSETVPTLTSGSTHVLQYLWKPQTEGTYNVTAYVPSVPGEYDTINNKMTAFITVAKPLIHPTEGQWATYNLTVSGLDRNLTYVMTWNFTYVKYISPALINVTLTSSQYQPGLNPTGWMILNIVTRQVERDSGIYWAGMWYPGWIETNINLGSVINLLMFNITVTGSQVIETMGQKIDCWRFDLTVPGYYSNNYTFWYDKATGVWIAMEITASINPPIKENLLLVATNIPIGPALKIETDKAMYVRNETATVQAIYKIGDTPIENAEVLVEVSYPDGTLWFTWTMTTDANGTATTSFLIPDFASPYGTYTIHATAYKPGMHVASATTTFRVVHYQAELILWFEGPSTALVNQHTTITLHVKNIGNLTALDVTAEFSVPADGNLQIIIANTYYAGTIEPGQEVTLMATVTASRPYRYDFDATAEYTWQSSNETPIVQAHKTLIYAYHLDYPVDLLNMTVSVTENTITVSLTVINYGDSPVEVTLIASAQQTATKLMLGSVYQKITIDPGQTITISLTMTIPSLPAQGEYDIQGILATGIHTKEALH